MSRSGLSKLKWNSLGISASASDSEGSRNIPSPSARISLGKLCRLHALLWGSDSDAAKFQLRKPLSSQVLIQTQTFNTMQHTAV